MPVVRHQNDLPLLSRGGEEIERRQRAILIEAGQQVVPDKGHGFRREAFEQSQPQCEE